MTWITTYCAESCKSFATDKRIQWVNTDHHNVDSEIKLETVEQQRLVKVSLADDLFVFHHVR